MLGEEKTQEEIEQKAAQTCFKHGGWSDQEKAEFLVRQSLEEVRSQKSEVRSYLLSAMKKLKEAKKLDPTIALGELEKEVNKLAASTLIKQGQELISETEEGGEVRSDVLEAKNKFREAKKLDPTVDLEKLEKEEAQILINRGKELAEKDEITKALIAYQKAQELDPNIKIDAELWNNLCLDGSLNLQAKEVLPACENAG